MQSFKGTKQSIAKQFPEYKANVATINHLGDSELPIEIFPSEVFFKGKSRNKLTELTVSCLDIVANQNYEVTVSIRNLTKKVRRVIVTQPKSGKFKIDYEQNGSLAAGLSMKLNVQFESREEGDFHDSVEIHTDGYREPIRLQMHAYKAGPDIQFEPVVNLKYIPFGQEKSEIVEFKNDGKKPGSVTLSEQTKSKTGIVIDPA
jgi:hypothetical protein